MKLYTLQILRFFAALCVLFFHLLIIKSGYKGVDVFFVISGYVMYYTTYEVKRKTIYKFYINRLTKIYLLYWIVLLSFYFIQPYNFDFSFIKTFFLFPNHYPILGISWTLSYELYFYFLFGIIAYSIKNISVSKSLYLILFVLSTIVALFNVTGALPKGNILNFLFGQNFWEFLLGILSAYLSARIRKKVSNISILITLLICSIVFILIEIPYENEVYHFIYGPLAFIIITAITAYEQNKKMNKYSAKIFGILGDASYAIYLIHPLIITIIVTRDNLSLFLIIIVTVILAVLLNQIIENNLLKITRQMLFEIFSKTLKSDK